MRAPCPCPYRGAELDTASLESPWGWQGRALQAGVASASAREGRDGPALVAPPFAPPHFAPPLRCYSEGCPRAQPAFCSSAAGASVCADLEGGGRSSSLRELGIRRALQPLARPSPCRSPSPSRGQGTAPVSCGECAGGPRREASGGARGSRPRPAACSCPEAALWRLLSGASGLPRAGTAASDPRPSSSCRSLVPLASSHSRRADPASGHANRRTWG